MSNISIDKLQLEVEGSADKAEKSIDKLTEKIQSYKNALSQYVILKQDLNHFNQIFDEMTLVKEALSSKKGMPLYQIKHYLGNTEEITKVINKMVRRINDFMLELEVPFDLEEKNVVTGKSVRKGDEHPKYYSVSNIDEEIKLIVKILL